MKISKSEVEKIAHLARLEIEDSQKEKMVEQLGNILQYIDKLKDADVDGLGIFSKAGVTDNVFREDTPEASPGPSITLANAPDRDEDFYVVPRVVK